MDVRGEEGDIDASGEEGLRERDRGLVLHRHPAWRASHTHLRRRGREGRGRKGREKARKKKVPPTPTKKKETPLRFVNVKQIGDDMQVVTLKKKKNPYMKAARELKTPGSRRQEQIAPIVKKPPIVKKTGGITKKGQPTPKSAGTGHLMLVD